MPSILYSECDLKMEILCSFCEIPSTFLHYFTEQFSQESTRMPRDPDFSSGIHGAFIIAWHIEEAPVARPLIFYRCFNLQYYNSRIHKRQQDFYRYDSFYFASAAPSALHAASSSSFGVRFAITPSPFTTFAPAARIRSTHLRIHSPSPQS